MAQGRFRRLINAIVSIFQHRELPFIAVFLLGIVSWAFNKISEEVLSSRVLEYQLWKSPANDAIHLRFTNISRDAQKDLVITVYDSSGKMVFYDRVVMDARPPMRLIQTQFPIDSPTTSVNLNINGIQPESAVDVYIPYKGTFAMPLLYYPLHENKDINILFKKSDIYTRIAKNRFSLYMSLMILAATVFILILIFKAANYRPNANT